MIETLKLEYKEFTEGVAAANKLRFDMANKRALTVLKMYEAGYTLINLERILQINESRIRTLIKRGKRYRAAQAEKTQKDE